MIVISSGHSLTILGASELISEAEENRRVVKRVVEYLRSGGVDVIEFHEDLAISGPANLNNIIAFHNSQQRDLDVSVHFNSVGGGMREAGIGTEVLYFSAQELATRVSAAVAKAGGFINRGAKKRTDLGFLSRTTKPAIIIEVCFVVSRTDVRLYQENFEAICHAIAESISGEKIAKKPVTVKRWYEDEEKRKRVSDLLDSLYEVIRG